MLRIKVAQTNPTIGAIEKNVEQMIDLAIKASAERAELVVFPELSLTAYYPADLLESSGFMERVASGIQQLKAASLMTPGLHWVIGAPTLHVGPGKKFHNSVLVILDGEVRKTYHKQLLPTYNIFDERRHFEPGPDVCCVMRVGSCQVGFLICEDGWNDDGKDYAVNPFERLAQASPDVVISLNASPSSVGKRAIRHSIFSGASQKHNLPLLYVNQVGGHDELVFDGGSFAVEPTRGVVVEGKLFDEDNFLVTFDESTRQFSAEEQSIEKLSNLEFYRRQIVLGVRDYMRRCGFSKALVGSSGGIDSALTIALAVEAVGAENVLAVTMPSKYSSEGSVSDSELLCTALGVELLHDPIEEIVAQYENAFFRVTGEHIDGIARQNLQPRIRGTKLMALSNTFGHLLLTTGNKSEISVGYCTIYGDTNGGLGLLGDLYKTDVFRLAAYLNEIAGREIIPSAIIEKPPSAELAPEQKDTDSLPPYEVLDEILKVLIEGDRLGVEEYFVAKKTFDSLAQTEEGRSLIEKVEGMIARNEYKRRQAPPILRLRSVAFGAGRQVPIAAQHRA